MTAATPEPRAERRALLRLAVPLAAQQVGWVAMGTVDALLLGRYSDAALAGAGIGNNLLFALTSVGVGLVMGLDTVVPQALGAGRRDDARRALGAGVRLAILVGLAATLAAFASPLVLEVAGVDRDVIGESRVYIWARAIGITPFLLTVGLRSYLAAQGHTRPLIVAVLAGNVVNAVLDGLLIFGIPALGLPALGVLGAAAATTFVQFLTVLLYTLAVRRIDRGQPAVRSTAHDIAHVTRYGGPVAGQLFAEVGIFSVATVLAGRLGRVPAAAHSIALNLASVTFSAAVGIASATSVRVGHAVGAGDMASARARGLQGVVAGLAIMACFAATFLLAPRAIGALFSDDREVVAATIPLLQIAALFQLSDGTQAIAAGALRGLGDTRSTLVGNLLGHYLVGLPIILALGFAAGMGAVGLWWGLSAGLTATAIYLVARFLRGTAKTQSRS